MRTPLSITFSFLLLTFICSAQKLPNVQKGSLFALQHVIIDGKAKEWGEMQAYNHATEIAYTLANDIDNLYFVAHATNEDVINKIVRGGITLSIQESGKKDAKNAVAITYPISEFNGLFHVQVIKSMHTDTSAQAIAIQVQQYNAVLQQNIKSIGVYGIARIDSLISIYNDNGIKAACQFDLKKTYILELCVPLKYLNLSSTDELKFAYHIILNGYKRLPTSGPITNKDGSLATGPAMQRVSAFMAQRYEAVSARTDFWGEYSLAKK